MFKKIRNIIQTIMFVYALFRAAQGWAYLIKESYDELKFQVKRRKNPDLTRYSARW
jgi:hypothetical protein